MKYIVVTGGVLSGLGKGISTSSIGVLLKSKGIKVSPVKIDPYLNVDAGTMNPYQHGEVFVLDDGAETDLDLGNYERFLDVNLTGDHNITTGKVYRAVIDKERRGDYLGKTVQIIPHVTDEIKALLRAVGEKERADVVLIEMGGTVGDIEGMPFLEAVRQLGQEVGKENVLYAHTTLVPVMGAVGEQKTKPTQQSVRELRAAGIQPHVIIARGERSLEPDVRNKIAFFSAGFEGAMIVLAAFYIIFVSVQKWIAGPHLQNLGIGTVVVLVAGLINGALGGYLIWAGKKRGSLILEANGKHVLTDCLTSLGVIVGLALVLLTGWLPFDPIFAIFVALNILWTGGNLIRRSVGGLMDEVDAKTQARILNVLTEMTSNAGVEFHGLRHRNAGNTIWVEFHLLFPNATSLQAAHELATQIEERIDSELGSRAEVTSHLETTEDHDRVHAREHYKEMPK